MLRFFSPGVDAVRANKTKLDDVTDDKQSAPTTGTDKGSDYVKDDVLICENLFYSIFCF